MIDYGGGIPSVDRIASEFPHKILEKISGTPVGLIYTTHKRNRMKCSIKTFNKRRRCAWTCRDGGTYCKIRT